jgi:protein-disulfide isomerase
MITITKSPLTVFFLSAMLIIFTGHSNFAQTNNPQLKTVSPMTLGNPDAPVKIVEYASFTCPHCATFHLDVLPNIKKKYLDKGLVQLEYREVYFDGPGLWAGLLARCKGNEKYFPMIDLIFKNQEDWAKGNIDNIKAGLLSMGRQAGLTDEESLTCMQDDNLAEELVVSFQENAKRDNISSTPTFLINGQLVKNLPFPEFEEIIEKYLEE